MQVVVQSKMLGFHSRCNGACGGQPSQISPKAETIVKNTFIELKEVEDEDPILVRPHRRNYTCPQQLEREEIAVDHGTPCVGLHETKQTAMRCTAHPSLATSCERSMGVSLNPRPTSLHIDIVGKELGKSMHMTPNFTTVVKNTFIDVEDEDIAVMRKCRRSIRTCPSDLRCGEDSPAYVPVPDLLSLCAEASVLTEAWPDAVDIMQQSSSLGTEDNQVLMDFKSVTTIKNTFIDLDVRGLDDEDFCLMQRSRRDSRTCPYDLGCREDMPAYVSLPSSPRPHNSSLSSSWGTDATSWQAADLGNALSSLAHDTGLVSNAVHLLPEDVSAQDTTFAKIYIDDLNREDLAETEKHNYDIQESPSDQIARFPAASMLAPTLRSDASPAHTSGQLFASGGVHALEISPKLTGMHVKPTVASVHGAMENLDCSGEVVSESRQRLRSYGNHYSMTCPTRIQQLTSLDSLVNSDHEKVPAMSGFVSDTSFMQSRKFDEISLFRSLMRDDRAMAYDLPPPPPYSAPSFGMLGTAFNTVQTQASSECCVPKSQADQPSILAPQHPPQTITEMWLLSGCASLDDAGCTCREDADIKAVWSPGETITEKPSMPSFAPVDGVACAAMQNEDTDADPADWAVAVPRRGPRGSRYEAAKPAKDSSSGSEKGSALTAPAAPHLAPKAATLLAARSIAKKSQCRSHADRLWCHLYIDNAMLMDGFDLVKKIIGREGCNTKTIYNETLTKVRVRGKGSGHRELRSRQEAPVHLMMALAADHCCHEDFKKAFVMAKELLQDVSRRFDCFSRRKHQHVQAGPRFWVGESTEESLSCLRDVLGDIPVGRLDLES